jgi:hypothetical protein
VWRCGEKNKSAGVQIFMICYKNIKSLKHLSDHGKYIYDVRDDMSIRLVKLYSPAPSTLVVSLGKNMVNILKGFNVSNESNLI